MEITRTPQEVRAQVNHTILSALTREHDPLPPEVAEQAIHLNAFATYREAQPNGTREMADRLNTLAEMFEP